MRRRRCKSCSNTGIQQIEPPNFESFLLSMDATDMDHLDLVSVAKGHLDSLAKSVESFKDLEGRTWRALRLSPLHRFDPTLVQT